MIFFAIVGFVITCNITLLLNIFQKETGIVYTENNIRFAAIVTFWNTAFISFVISLEVPSNVLLTILSSMFHEFGHLFTMISLDNKPLKVRFELTGINIIRNQETVISVKNEIFISLGGPIINALI